MSTAHDFEARVVGTHTRLRCGWHAVSRFPHVLSRAPWAQLAQAGASTGFLALLTLLVFSCRASCSEDKERSEITGYVFVEYDSAGDVGDCVIVPVEVTSDDGGYQHGCRTDYGDIERPMYYFESSGSRRSTNGFVTHAITNGVDEATIMKAIHMPSARCRRIDVEEEEIADDN